MTDYKATLNLPNTCFPMKAGLSQREPQILKSWQEKKIYQTLRNLRQTSSRFVLHDGPPYANGHLHCGHALNKILKDIIVKSKSLSEMDAPFVPGWDCHGLPIELNVEKKQGKAGDKLTPAAFRQACRNYAASQIDIQRDEFKRLGVFGQWDKPYATYDFNYEANIIRALAKIIQNGHLEQGFKPVHWCIACGSALAEAEVEYENKTSPSIDVAFIANDFEEILKRFHHADEFLKVPRNPLFLKGDKHTKPVIVPIWTTTPWTLPANEAVCLHPELDYVLLDAGNQYFVVASALQEQVMKRLQHDHVTVCAQLPGRALEGLMLRHPFLDKVVPIVLGTHVTTDAGTGCVHTAPAHGAEDYQVGKVYQLPLMNPVLQNGCFAEDVPFLAGVHVLKANDIVLSLLGERHVLLHEEALVHSYPHCWRHKTPMIFLATPQWFISMEKNGLRSALLAEIKKVTWIPEWGEARIQSMIESRPDWCISRQRAWGTPIALLIHKTTRELHPDTQNLLERVALAVAEGGIERWFSSSVSDWLDDDAADYEKVNDTLDVWFDAGVSHFSVLSQDKQLSMPSDLVLEGSDQHRGWFNSSLTTAVAMFGHAPYRSVLTHGYTTDAEGKKLSKSKGNYIALDKLVAEHGADIIRLWVASTEYRHDVSISEEIMKRTADAYRRIRNTARFLLSNLFDFDPMKDMVNVNHMVLLDKLAILRTATLQEEIVEAYDTYQFHVIYQKIYHFCNIDLGSFYLDVIKDRQYTSPKDSLSRRSCQTAMYHMLQALTRWLAPVLSFTADEIWSYIPGDTKESVFLTTWYAGYGDMNHEDLHLWQRYQAVRDEVNQALEVARQAGTIGSGLAAEVTLFAKPDLYDILHGLGDELHFLLITSAARLLPWEEAPEGLVCLSELGLKVQVDVSAHTKCARCWHRVGDVGHDERHPAICGRCVATIESQGMERRFA